VVPVSSKTLHKRQRPARLDLGEARQLTVRRYGHRQSSIYAIFAAAGFPGHATGEGTAMTRTAITRIAMTRIGPEAAGPA
jgi:hypothetical protein